LETLQRQRSVELERVVKQHKADALRRASRQKDALDSSIRAQRKALQSLAAGDGLPFSPFVVLDTPYLIVSTPPGSNSAAVPWGSWAKFDFKTSASGSELVNFFFVWENPNPVGDYTVLNAMTYMTATGYLKAHSPWHNGHEHESSVETYAQFSYGIDLFGGGSSSGEVFLGEATATSNLVFGDDDAQSISAAQQPILTGITVPSTSSVVFWVSLWVYYRNDRGDIEADFKSGNFRIFCPFVAFTFWDLRPPRPVVKG
jgi:hypothetical protein